MTANNPTVKDYLSDILTILESIDTTLIAIQNAVEKEHK